MVILFAGQTSIVSYKNWLKAPEKRHRELQQFRRIMLPLIHFLKNFLKINWLFIFNMDAKKYILQAVFW